MQSLSWQKQLAEAIRHPEELLEYVGLDADSIGYSRSGLAQFPLRIPHAFARRIAHRDPHDPILRQVFPYIDEDKTNTGYVVDPLEEVRFQPLPGLIKKYHDRALLVTTGACAIHCRYCFRRHFPYEEATNSPGQWQDAMDYIRDKPDIREVILSGGDPLSLSDAKLLSLCQRIAEIKHVERIRLHTRFPVVIPDRLNNKLLSALTATDKQIIVVLHINHANEIDSDVSRMLKTFGKHPIYLLNQSVLLRNINDNVTSLVQLSEQLVGHHVVPYYLHLLDPVAGAAHFNVQLPAAQQLISKMRDTVAGYMVPTLVMEKTDKKSKTLVEGLR